MTMVWRSVAKVDCKAAAFAGVGGILFAVSDGLLSCRLFGLETGMDKKMNNLIVMSSYYAAQFCFTASVLETKV